MREKLQAARFKLAYERPYLAAGLWAMTPVERSGLGGVAADRFWRLYYDPEACKAWEVAELAGVLYHLLSHLLRDHASRALALGAERELWELAADLEINDDLLGEGVSFPWEVPTPKALGLPQGRLAEEYYQALKEKREEKGGAEGKGSSISQGQGEGEEKDGGAPASSSGGRVDKRGDGGGSRPPSSSEATGSASGKAGAPSLAPSLAPNHAGGSLGKDSPDPRRSGSAAHGRPEPWEDPPPGEGGAPGVGEVEGELIRRKVAEDIRVARGTVPGHWQHWAEARLRPKVDWRRELKALIRQAVADKGGAVDYSYRRPSRRQSASQVVLPSLREPIPEVALIVDTSGSMGDGALAQALAEVGGVLRALGLRQGIRVLSVDSQVQAINQVFRLEEVKLLGGGGTDMRVGLAAASWCRARAQGRKRAAEEILKQQERALEALETQAALRFLAGKGGK